VTNENEVMTSPSDHEETIEHIQEDRLMNWIYSHKKESDQTFTAAAQSKPQLMKEWPIQAVSDESDRK
jgi:uncharacterized membrane protein YkgB